MLSLTIFLILLSSRCLLCVKAGLFVVNPQQGSACHGGEACTVTWLDDGVRPLLSEIGLCTVGLYTGQQKLVQSVTPTDVSRQLSLTFIPDPAAGPNSDAYYLSFISTSAKQNNSLPYAAFSPFFRLDQMTGSFITPDPSATLPIPIPTSITANGSSNTTVLSTITVGTIVPSITSSSSVSFNATTVRSSQTVMVSSTAPHTQPSSFTTLTSLTSTSGFSLASSAALSSSTLTIPASSLLLSPSVPITSASSPSSGSNSGALGMGLSNGAGISVAAFVGIVGFFLTF